LITWKRNRKVGSDWLRTRCWQKIAQPVGTLTKEDRMIADELEAIFRPVVCWSRSFGVASVRTAVHRNSGMGVSEFAALDPAPKSVWPFDLQLTQLPCAQVSETLAVTPAE
jgi:hypothetical protein